ncbi:hypothetical protein [Actinoallomurus sp. CA-150999]|uniref:hypothetical protein n=1 Tax=Actinoallomurus sp. CA-150999 TaxID=3239887 RepID=UPI003D8FC0DA
MGFRIKALLGLTAAGIAASSLAPTAAQASGYFAFCNVSSTNEYFQISPYGNSRGLYSSLVSPGTCYLTSFSPGTAYRQAVAYREVNGQYPAVATRWFYENESVTWNV